MSAEPQATMNPTSVLSLARADLACYAMLVSPGFELPYHIELIVQKLEAVERGDCRRLVICCPPRHGKSLTAGALFPAYYLGRHPDHSAVLATYGQDLSDDGGRRVRNLLSDPLHQAIFPACRLAGDSQNQRRFDTTAGGSFYAVGRGGPLTGRGANLLIIDDPLKDRDEARSENIRRSLHEWYSNVARTRLAPAGTIVIVSTRWHEDDLAGRQLRDHATEGWHLLSFPAIAEEDEGFRPAGEALWPERFPKRVLEEIRSAIGNAAFQSLYQQRPAALEGAIFKRQWFRLYRESPTSFERIVQSWDCAYGKSKDSGDWTVATTWGVAPNGYYLLNVFRARCDFPELQRKFYEQAEQWCPSSILVEDTVAGSSLIQQLRSATRHPVLAIKPSSSKEIRADSCTPLFESGRVFFPADAPWLNDFCDEMANFPNAAHDDCVDSVTQFLNWSRSRAQKTVTFSQVLI